MTKFQVHCEVLHRLRLSPCAHHHFGCWFRSYFGLRAILAQAIFVQTSSCSRGRRAILALCYRLLKVHLLSSVALFDAEQTMTIQEGMRGATPTLAGCCGSRLGPSGNRWWGWCGLSAANSERKRATRSRASSRTRNHFSDRSTNFRDCANWTPNWNTLCRCFDLLQRVLEHLELGPGILSQHFESPFQLLNSLS